MCLRSDADFILLVEKEAAYMRMAEDRFYQKYPCIVITAKGQPVRRQREDRLGKQRRNGEASSMKPFRINSSATGAVHVQTI